MAADHYGEVFAEGDEVKSYWREKAAPIIRRVIAENAGQPMQAVRKALHNAYPFGPRQYHPYKIWLDECQKQLGTKKKKSAPADPSQMRML